MAFSEKFNQVLENEELMKKLESAETEEACREILTAEGIDIDQEWANAVNETEEAELGEEELAAVAGGASWSGDINKLINQIGNVLKYGWTAVTKLNILIRANRDYKKGNMYKTYTKSEVRAAYNWLAPKVGMSKW